jgi:hypothetical protein
MKNLRILQVNIVDSLNISVIFTETLSNNIKISNIKITSETPNVEDPNITSIYISYDTLNIGCQPLTPFATYSIEFISTDAVKFKSLNGDAIILEDGVANKQFILGPIDPSNVINDYLTNYLRDNIYNITDSSTFASKIMQGFSVFMSDALYNIRQAKNENYLSNKIVDERKVRGQGPFDRLSEEGAYEVLRVGKTQTNATAAINKTFSSFPYYPVSLYASNYSDLLIPDSQDNIGIFNINSLNITVSKFPVSKLTSVVFTYTDTTPDYTYNIEKYGYQILDSIYDQEYGFTYYLLNNNQFRLNTEILSDINFSLQNINKIQVQYEYRDLGIVIDPASLVIYSNLTSVRETLPPILNVFNLKHAPIVDNNGNIASLGAVKFLNFNSFNPNIPNPAFTKELIFNFNSPPSRIGEYSIDYSTGTVYVYGSDNSKNGTTGTPPLASYNYKHVYTPEIDYVYDSDTGDTVSLPYGNLRYNSANIDFNYEKVFVPGVDYQDHIHKESLEERVNNNLIALNALRVKNSKITDVYRVYNESSGEIYNVIRWHDDKIYFSYNNPPNVSEITNERASFENILNEYLFINDKLTNVLSIPIYKILLKNNNIISASEDCVGSNINTSVFFSDTKAFNQEIWYNSSGTETNNINRLKNIGEYQIDYLNGVIYCAVQNNQSNTIGFVSYKRGYIAPTYPHVISVDDIYYKINLLGEKNKNFAAASFGEGFIIPDSFDVSDEAYLNGNLTAPYQLYYGSGNTIGYFDNLSFISGVTNDIKYMRSLYEYNDLENNTKPINFASYTTFNGKIITYNNTSKQEFASVLFDGTNYYVNINETIKYLSPNITFNMSVIRLSDSAQLFDGYISNIIVGDSAKLLLTQNFPNTNDAVVINYSISINDLSRVIVDYNRGDYYIDYSYLGDEIVVSYEYGDNYLDFRKSSALSAGEEYYVTYKVGALRSALLNNFGKLINIPELATFDVDLNRERYRDALRAALESFIKGPTVAAIKNIVNNISHIEPEIIESIFDGWSLGSSLLLPQLINAKGNIKLLPAKYGNGALINSSDQSISFPTASNFKLEQGSLECWVIPEWSGIDSASDLTFKILKDNSTIKSTQIFIGAAEYHPTINLDGTFTINKLNDSSGTPNKNKDGVFIYYDKDASGLFDRWFVDVVDGYVGTPFNPSLPNYSFNIKTNGLFYDAKSLISPQPSNLKISTGTDTLKFYINGGDPVSLGVTFIADNNKYLFDCGEDANKNRISIYKDPSGYLNFKIFDKFKNSYSLSCDVSNWKSGDKHHVATSWKLNSADDRDEMHLFIDGFEVPNIIKYGNKVGPYLHEKFRTINPEEIAGAITKNIIGSIDLVTVAGSTIVTSSINFSSYNILIGDTIFIHEQGFSNNGYIITNVNGQTLSLNAAMPLSLNNAKYSVNETSIKVTSEIDIYPNIAISTISSYFDGYDGYILQNSNTFWVTSVNLVSQGASAGDLIRIENNNFESHYVILNVTPSYVVINGSAPLSTPIGTTTYHIYKNSDVEIPGERALIPSYYISKDGYYNNILTISNNAKVNDLILIKTLGLNHRRIRKQYYVWGNSSNIIGTKLPTPISLNEVDIKHVLIPSQIINKYNSILVPLISFNFNQVCDGYTSDNIYGRTLNIELNSSNLDFSQPVNVTLTGYSAGNTPISETITFTSSDIIASANKYVKLHDISVSANYINQNKGFAVVNVKEKYAITYPENILSIYPAIRYSYQIISGSSLNGSGTNEVYDNSTFFSVTNIGNYLYIPSGIATGYYLITGVSNDNKTLILGSSTAAFSAAPYQIINVSAYNSGFQNGYFIFEIHDKPKQPFLLPQGFYEFDYYSYLKLEMDPLAAKCFIGSDFNNQDQIKAIVDELNITSNIMTDTRVGETALSNVSTFTKNFNSVKELKSNTNTLMLSHFSSYPLSNDSEFYIRESGKYNLSSVTLNDNFSESLFIEKNPLILDNDGILTPRTEGTIEFWVNSKYDTYNDPNVRYYFDATSVINEEVVSINNVDLKLKGKASKIVSVKLKHGDKNIDYFAGGRIEIAAAGALSENAVSANISQVSVSKKVLQVISVKIQNDPVNMDYFANGTIGTDKRTLYLGKPLPLPNLPLVVVYKTSESFDSTFNTQVVVLNKELPFTNTPVIVSYIPIGMQGDRISIFKDKSGYVNFNITASEINYLVRTPALWSKNTWHRIKATFKVNGGSNNDELRLFVDGYEQSDILFGNGAVFGNGMIFGDPYLLGLNSYKNKSISFKDPINEIFIGSAFDTSDSAYALFNNLRISNIARPVYKPFGESIDVAYTSNISAAIPVTQDLYATFLLDTKALIYRNENYAVLRNLNSNNFDFNINVFDSFDIIKNSNKVKEILEILINVLKPANSRAFISYII